eukprot:666533-Pleurochrysis_carterae.AAC.1
MVSRRFGLLAWPLGQVSHKFPMCLPFLQFASSTRRNADWCLQSFKHALPAARVQATVAEVDSEFPRGKRTYLAPAV